MIPTVVDRPPEVLSAEFFGYLAKKQSESPAMNKYLRTAMTVSLALVCLPALSQWPAYPTADVPRTADGAPDLEAPPPRTAWGTPDFSGIWENYPPFGQASPEDVQDPDAPPLAAFWDLGENFENGLPYTEQARVLKAARMADNMKDNPDAHCLPIGYMQLHKHPQPHKIVQTEDLIVMIWESNGGLRQIFLDGRELPDSDALPWWYGYSVGHWEGDTLVVESTGFRDDVWLDVNGSPLTNTGKITERFTRENYGRMNIDVTIEDPASYTMPFTVRVEHGIMLDTNLIEFICNENEMSSQFFDP